MIGRCGSGWQQNISSVVTGLCPILPGEGARRSSS